MMVMANYSVCPYCGTPVEATPQNIEVKEENGKTKRSVICELCKKVVFLPSSEVDKAD